MNPPPLSCLNRISKLKPPHDPCFHNLNGYLHFARQPRRRSGRACGNRAHGRAVEEQSLSGPSGPGGGHKGAAPSWPPTLPCKANVPSLRLPRIVTFNTDNGADGQLTAQVWQGNGVVVAPKSVADHSGECMVLEIIRQLQQLSLTKKPFLGSPTPHRRISPMVPFIVSLSCLISMRIQCCMLVRPAGSRRAGQSVTEQQRRGAKKRLWNACPSVTPAAP